MKRNGLMLLTDLGHGPQRAGNDTLGYLAKRYA
ncbi:hypothetical protein FHS46_002970 [Variibacter gotjawalensis]|nr:hypothetical protein [Variibacter gotjawalensis]